MHEARIVQRGGFLFSLAVSVAPRASFGIQVYKVSLSVLAEVTIQK